MGNVLLRALEAKLGESRQVHYQQHDEYAFECPRCSNGKWKFGINFEKKVFNCFKCHWAGKLHELVRELGIKLDDLRDIVPSAPQRAADGPGDGPSVPAQIPGYIPFGPGGSSRGGQVMADALAYARRRGRMEPDDIEDNKLGVSCDPELAGRLIVPVIQGGVVVNYLARSVYPHVQPKEITGPLWQGWLPRSELFFGHDQLRTASHVVIVEGFWDWWRMRQVSRSWSSVALMGSSLSHVVCGKLLASQPRRITIFLDGDPAGEDGTFQVGTELLRRRMRNVYVARPPAGKDPDELQDEQILLLVNNAVPFTAWMAAR